MSPKLEMIGLINQHNKKKRSEIFDKSQYLIIPPVIFLPLIMAA